MIHVLCIVLANVAYHKMIQLRFVKRQSAGNLLGK